MIHDDRRVPAETFDDCWTALAEGTYHIEQTYCRGIGMVRQIGENF